ncbi:MAG: hypothetical protein B7Z15_17360, partial [Rhizobiales bacterium 32-66-8]
FYEAYYRPERAVLHAFEEELFPALDQKQTRTPVVPEGARRSTMTLPGRVRPPQPTISARVREKKRR